MKRKSDGELSLTAFDEAARPFANLRTGRCNWCLNPFQKTYRSGLCRHCYRIKSDQRRLLREVKSKWKTKPGVSWRTLDLRLRIACHVAGRMEDMARAEGQSISQDRESPHSSMAVEQLLTYISRQLLPRKEHNLYYNCATTISGMFSPVQREALIHLLSETVDLHKRHNRKKRAAASSAKLVADSQHMPIWLKEALGECR